MTAFGTHLQATVTTLCYCWRVSLRDGTVFGFTDHDRALVLDGTEFAPETGFSASEARRSEGLGIDTADVEGVLSSDRITEKDILDGRYDGALRLDWIRRARIDADRGLAGSPPLDEAAETYRVDVAPEGGATVRSVTVGAPQWTYAAADIAADLGGAPATAAFTVRQIGAVAGDPATLTLDLN